MYTNNDLEIHISVAEGTRKHHEPGRRGEVKTEGNERKTKRQGDVLALQAGFSVNYVVGMALCIRPSR